MQRIAVWVGVGLCATASWCADVTFTAKPAVRKTGDRATIQFAVSAPTDVAVAVLDATNRVVRHLVAGVLGKNPPAPLQADALAQVLEWDGRDDDGKPAENGPFRVRVGLGLRADYAGPAFMETAGPNELNSVWALAVAADGRLYVMDDRAAYGDTGSSCVGVHVLRRDGSYERTIDPFPPNLPVERLQGTGAFRNDRGYLNPMVYNSMWWNFFPFKDCPLAQMVLADGKLWLAVGDWNKSRLAAIDLDGGIPLQPFPGPTLGPWPFGQPRLAMGSDGKSLFMTGFGGKGGLQNGETYRGAFPFVARTKLPEQGAAEIAFGDSKQKGNDNAHLNEPRGVAADGQGHLLVCDSGNNRVVVLNEKDMSFAGSFDVPAPEWVGCHPKSGAVYVASADALIKFSGWKDPKEEYRLDLSEHKKGIPKAYLWSFGRCFALDGAAVPPVLWIGQSKGEGAKNWVPLLRCEDLGDKFAAPVAANCYSILFRRGLTADPYRREVACQEVGSGVLLILDEETGIIRKVTGVMQGGGINRLGPDGAIYSNAHCKGIKRWDRDGKPKPFEVTDTITPGGLAGMAGAMGTTIWERDYSIDRKNDIYTKLTGAYYHGLQHVGVFGQDGKLKRTALWGITDGSYGPKLDPKGNIYLMEAVKPLGEPFPAEFQPVINKSAQYCYNWMYGSILKFGPQGGNLIGLNVKGMPYEVSFPGLSEGTITNHHSPGYGSSVYASDPVPLPDTARKIRIEGTNERKNTSSYAQGAEWIVPGVGYTEDMGDMGGGGRCHCVGCDFDVDDFGRTFAPDNGRFRVTVIDTAGNAMLHFGAYGNQDCWGPDSYVVDPETKLLRPRTSDDPKELKSPFAEPEIAFNRIVGLAVTDRYVYVADYKNRRVLRCALRYATEGLADVK